MVLAPLNLNQLVPAPQYERRSIDIVASLNRKGFDAAQRLRETLSPDGPEIGLRVQWNIVPEGQSIERIAVVATGTEEHCVLWLVAQIGAVPPDLRAILEDTNIRKVGAWCYGGIELLRKLYGVHVRGYSDVLQCFQRRYAEPKIADLSFVCGHECGESFRLRQELMRKDWERQLSAEQVAGASQGALVALRAMRAMRARRQVSDALNRERSAPDEEGGPPRPGAPPPGPGGPPPSGPAGSRAGPGAAAADRATLRGGPAACGGAPRGGAGARGRRLGAAAPRGGEIGRTTAPGPVRSARGRFGVPSRGVRVEPYPSPAAAPLLYPHEPAPVGYVLVEEHDVPALYPHPVNPDSYPHPAYFDPYPRSADPRQYPRPTTPGPLVIEDDAPFEELGGYEEMYEEVYSADPGPGYAPQERVPRRSRAPAPRPEPRARPPREPTSSSSSRRGAAYGYAPGFEYVPLKVETSRA
eukprot:tig00020956_g16520.t1